jgi:hypothetical protein
MISKTNDAEQTQGGEVISRDPNEYRSETELFGLPLVHVARGIDPRTGFFRVAKGIIAIGDVAVGFLALGGIALGGIAIGGLGLGLIAIGGLALGAITIGVSGVIVVNISAQHGDVGLPIPLAALGLPTRKTAIQRHSALQLKRVLGFRTSAGLVDPLRHPDFVVRASDAQGSLQRAGVSPVAAVTAPAATWLNRKNTSAGFTLAGVHWSQQETKNQQHNESSAFHDQGSYVRCPKDRYSVCRVCEDICGVSSLCHIHFTIE